MMKKILSRNNRLVLRMVGLLWGGYIIAAYAFGSYSQFAPAALVISVALVALSFIEPAEKKESNQQWYRRDTVAVLLLLASFVPLYVYKIYSVPWQINTDEVTIMLVAKKLLTEPGTDWFGLSYYFGFPSLIFVVFGWLSNLLGGIDLEHFRVVHALFGVGSVALFYALSRQFFSPLKSFSFAVILGTNHALFAISRMAMRDNTGLFLELLALVFLVHGFKSKNLFTTFLGSVATGLGFYTYFPGRIILAIWLAVLLVLLAMYPVRRSMELVLQHLGIFLLGFSMIAAPVLIATVRDTSQAFRYQKQQFLFYKEGRELQQTWNNAPTLSDAWKENIKSGLLTFNKPLSDQGYIYPNYNHGFLDTFSGALLWVGFLIALVRLFRRNRTLQDLLAIIGFLALYLSFAFLITKAPNYTRLLVVLPFTSYFIGEALWWAGEYVSRVSLRGHLEKLRSATAAFLVFVALAVIVRANAVTFHDFVKKAEAEGNDVGSTARFVEARKKVLHQRWVLAADPSYMYYSWGDSWQWESWLGFFAGENQEVTVVPPAEAFLQTHPIPTIIFTNTVAWAVYEQEFKYYNKLFSVRNITPDGRLLAIEIRGIR